MGETPMNPEDLLIDNNGGSITSTIRSLLGIEQEQHVCSKCNTPCSKSTTYDVRTAAFNQGTQPSWECPECGAEYIREPDTDKHTLDLYGKGL